MKPAALRLFLSLTDLDRPILEDIRAPTFKGLQKLLSTAKTVLRITRTKLTILTKMLPLALVGHSSLRTHRIYYSSLILTLLMESSQPLQRVSSGSSVASISGMAIPRTRLIYGPLSQKSPLRKANTLFHDFSQIQSVMVGLMLSSARWRHKLLLEHSLLPSPDLCRLMANSLIQLRQSIATEIQQRIQLIQLLFK